MRRPENIFRSFPAFSRAVLLLLFLNLLTWIGMRICASDHRPVIFLLGDSSTGNYRVVPGERLQDGLQALNPHFRIATLAIPGACPLDFLLQYCKGLHFFPEPQQVILIMAPSKFLHIRCETRHLYNNGENLGWIPLNRLGWSIWQRLTPAERSTAVIRKTSLLLYGFTDLIADGYRKFYRWPHWRQQLRQPGSTFSSCHAERVRQCTIASGQELDSSNISSEAQYDTLLRARDADFLLQELRRRRIKALTVSYPYGNPTLLQRFYPASALIRRDSLCHYFPRWFARRGIPVIDLNTRAEMRHFPAAAWDDAEHIISPDATFHICRLITTRLQSSYRFSEAF